MSLRKATQAQRGVFSQSENPGPLRLLGPCGAGVVFCALCGRGCSGRTPALPYPSALGKAWQVFARCQPETAGSATTKHPHPPPPVSDGGRGEGVWVLLRNSA